MFLIDHRRFQIRARHSDRHCHRPCVRREQPCAGPLCRLEELWRDLGYLVARRCNRRPPLHSAGSPLGDKMEISLEKEEAMEVGVLLLLLTLLSAVVFGGWLEISAKNYPIAFICGPIVIWTAFRFTQRETATGIFIPSSDSGVGNSARLRAICWSK